MKANTDAIDALLGNPQNSEVNTAELDEMEGITREFTKWRGHFNHARTMLTLNRSPDILKEGLHRFGVAFFLEMVSDNMWVDPKDYAKELIVCLMLGHEPLQVIAYNILKGIEPDRFLPFIRGILDSKKDHLNYDMLVGLSMLRDLYDPATKEIFRAFLLKSADQEIREIAERMDTPQRRDGAA